MGLRINSNSEVIGGNISFFAIDDADGDRGTGDDYIQTPGVVWDVAFGDLGGTANGNDIVAAEYRGSGGLATYNFTWYDNNGGVLPASGVPLPWNGVVGEFDKPGEDCMCFQPHHVAIMDVDVDGNLDVVGVSRTVRSMSAFATVNVSGGAPNSGCRTSVPGSRRTVSVPRSRVRRPPKNSAGRPSARRIAISGSGTMSRLCGATK